MATIPPPRTKARASAIAGPASALGYKIVEGLHALPARGVRGRHAPLIKTSGRPFPVVGSVEFVAVVDLQHFGRVFERAFFGAGEIAEGVVAWAVSAKAPFEGIAAVMHAPRAAHDGFEIAHLEGDVLEGLHAEAAQHKRAMIGRVSIEEELRACVVHESYAEHVSEQAGHRLYQCRVDVDVADFVGPVAKFRIVGMVRAIAHHDEAAAGGVAQGEPVAAVNRLPVRRLKGSSLFVQTRTRTFSSDKMLVVNRLNKVLTNSDV